MGYWGMGITQSDEYCDVYEKFMEEYNEGKEVSEITATILAEYHEEFDDNDGILHDVYFALAKAEWMCCEQSAEILSKVHKIIESGDNIQFYRELEASESDLKQRQKSLDKFWLSLQTPRKSPRKRTASPKNESAVLKKGDLFWYRSKSVIYGALILDIVNKTFLIAHTNALSKAPKTAIDILEESVYTVVWTWHLLPPNRIHCIDTITIDGCYNGRAGMYAGEKIYYCENTDLDIERRSLKIPFPDKKIKDLLIIDNVPDTFLHPDRLNQAIAQAKLMYGEDKTNLIQTAHNTSEGILVVIS